MQDNNKEVIRKYIMEQAKLSKLEDTERIIETNLLDSMGLVELAAWLGKRFAIQITDDDFSEENFFDLLSLTRLVEKKKVLKGS